MESKEYNKLIDELIDEARGVSKEKGQDYTIGSEDVLANFKAVAERTGLDPKKVLAIYMMKHQDAISNYVKSGGQSESEPIKMRIIDNINYLCLLWGLIEEKNYENKLSESKRTKAATKDRPKTINILPDADGKGYKVYVDGGVRSGYSTVGESKPPHSLHVRGKESGEIEYMERIGTVRGELRAGEDPRSSVQEESQ